MAAAPATEPTPLGGAVRRLLAGGLGLAMLAGALALARVDTDWDIAAGPDRRMAALLDASVADPTPAQLAQARAALADRPLDGRAYRVLAVGAAQAGDAQRAARLLAIAVQRWPRDPAGRALAAEQAFARGDVRGALQHLDALMRVAPAMRPAALALLAPHLGDAPLRAALIERLALSPPWRGALVPALADAPPDAALALLGALEPVLPLSPAELALRLRLLQQQGRADLARDAWLRSLPASLDADDGDAAVYDGGFEHDATEGGFGWQLQPPPGVSIERDGIDADEGRSALAIEFDGRAVAFAGVRQALALAPGRYAFEAASDNAVDTTRPFEWRLGCDGAGDLLHAPLPSRTGWQRVQVEFAVPPGCTSQTLVLRHTGRSLAERRLRGRLRVDGVGIFPIP